MSSSQSSVNQQVMNCPACHQPVYATLSTDVQMDMTLAKLSESRTVDATVKVTGMRLQHDCVPKVARSQWEAIGR